MISDETWDRFQEQYGVDGYTDSIVFIKLDKLIELDSQIESIKELLKSQPSITVTPQGYYSVHHIWPAQGLKIVEEIMRILFDQASIRSEPK